MYTFLFNEKNQIHIMIKQNCTIINRECPRFVFISNCCYLLFCRYFVMRTGEDGFEAIKSNPRGPGDHEAGSRNRCLCQKSGFIEDAPLGFVDPNINPQWPLIVQK